MITTTPCSASTYINEQLTWMDGVLEEVDVELDILRVDSKGVFTSKFPFSVPYFC
jgi:hypothetical protein